MSNGNEDAKELYNLAQNLHEERKYEESIMLKLRAANISKQKFKYSQALKLFKEVYEEGVNILGPDDPLTLTTLTSIGILFCELAQFDEALDILQKVGVKRENALGPEDDSVLFIKSWMARALSGKHKYEDSLKIYREIYTIKERNIPGDPENLLSAADIAETIALQGDYKAALEMLCDIYDKLVEAGCEQLHILAIKNNIGFILLKSLKFKKAIEILKDVYENRTALLGAEHPATLKSGSTLGYALTGFGDPQKALEILTEVFDKMTNILGEKHLETLNTQSSIAEALGLLGRHLDSLHMFSKVLILLQEIYPDSPTVLIIKESIARQYSSLSNYEEALRILNEVYSIRKASRPLHQHTLCTNFLIGSTLLQMNRPNEALTILKYTYKVQSDVLGLENHDTVNTQKEIGLVLYVQGKYDEALKIFKNVYEIRKRRSAKGFGYVDYSLDALYNMGLVYYDTGENDRALQIFNIILSAKRTRLSEDNPSILTIQHNIAVLLARQLKLEEAYEIIHDVYRRRLKCTGAEHPHTVSVLKTIQEIFSLMPKSYLLEAVGENDLSKVKICIENGCDVNRKDIDGCVALHKASEKGNSEIMKLLLESGAFYDVKNSTGEIPSDLASNEEAKNLLNSVDNLFRFVKAGNFDTFGELDKKLLIVNAKDDAGTTPLHWACHKGYANIVARLLELGADPTLFTIKGNTPLHIATSKGYANIVQLLLKNVKETNPRELYNFINYKTSGKGTTSLHVAAKNGDLETIKLLLKNGANVDARNVDGKKALDFTTSSIVIDIISSYTKRRK